MSRKEDEASEAGYLLGFSLIAMLVAFNLLAVFVVPLPERGQRGAGTVLIGVFVITIGLMFLASYYYSHKTFLFRGLIWFCENFSRPAGRGMAFFYFALATSLGIGAILSGLGII